MNAVAFRSNVSWEAGGNVGYALQGQIDPANSAQSGWAKLHMTPSFGAPSGLLARCNTHRAGSRLGIDENPQPPLCQFRNPTQRLGRTDRAPCELGPRYRPVRSGRMYSS